MKNTIQLLANLISWFCLSFYSFFGILWYGKLPKVSLYHWVNNQGLYTTKGIYNNPNEQTFNPSQVPDILKSYIIEEYIGNLFDDEAFRTNVMGLHIPIFDGKYIIGNQGVITIFERVKDLTLNSAKKI